MKKTLISALLFVLLLACAPDASLSVTKSPVDLSDLTEKLSSSLGETETLSKERLIPLLHLDPETTVSASGSFASDESPMMIIAVESNSPDAALKTTEKLAYYAETLRTTAGLYSPDQLPLLENAWTITRDTRSFLIISSSLEDLKVSLLEALETSG